jgi:acyl-CoA reductase-like NAD-dependent aldehyde dehydrogenase
MGSQITRDETQLLIGGKWVEAGNGAYDVINPATEQVVGQAPDASVADAEQAAEAAREALPAWAATPAEERLALLKAAAVAIRAKNEELVPLVIAETGATASVGSRMQVPVCADRFDRYSRDIRHVQESMLPPIVTAATPLAPGGLISALAYRQPVGVVAAIASYNFPLTNMAGKVAPALVSSPDYSRLGLDHVVDDAFSSHPYTDLGTAHGQPFRPYIQGVIRKDRELAVAFRQFIGRTGILHW